MALLLEHILFLFAVLTFVFAGAAISGENRKLGENRAFYAFCMGSTVWSLCFGLLIIQETPDAAWLCRVFGMAGTFLYLIMANMLLVRWSRVGGLLKRLFFWFPFLAVFLYPFTVRPGAATFYITDFGMSYELNKDLWSALYSAYTVIMFVNDAVMIALMMRRGRKMRERVMGRRLLLCLLFLALGTVFDTILPQFGYAAVPGSTITQFFGAAVMLAVLRYSNKARITFSNMSEYVYHSLQVKVPMFIFDENGRLRIVNASASEQFGIDEMNCGELSIKSIFDTDIDIMNIKDGRAGIEAAKRGCEMYYYIDINEICDDFNDVIGYIAILTDLTEKTKYINALKKAREEADSANMAKELFLANMSLELKTPINAVLGMNEIIIRESGEEKIVGYATSIKNAGKSLLLLLNDILDFSKLETGRLELACSEYMTKDFIKGITNLFVHKAGEKNLQLHVSADPALPKALYGDEARLRQMLINLTGNAIKYTERGDIWLRVRLKAFNEKEKTAGIHFEVEDTGPGIKESEIDKLFSPFTRLDDDRFGSVNGNGLGLVLVRRLAELMNGSVSVRSEYGCGSCFCIDVEQGVVSEQPVGRFDAVSLGFGAVHSFRPGFAAPDASILIVDDNETSLQVICGLLRGFKLRTAEALSGQECLCAVREHSYDIILLDHMMPGMDGIETLSRLRAMPDNLSSSAVVIALTANDLVGAREFYTGRGFDDYLPKPVEYSRLEKMLMRYLPQETIVENEDEIAAGVSDEGSIVLQNAGEILREGNLDFKAGLVYCHDMGVYAATARSFCAACDDYTKGLSECFQKGDMKNYRILVHSIKANAKTLGAGKLYEISYAQEKSCMPDGVGIRWDDLKQQLEEVRRVASVLKNMLEYVEAGMDSDVGQKGRISDEELIARLEELLAYARDFDDENVTLGLSVLLKYEHRGGLKAELQLAEKYMQMYKYAETAALLESMLVKIRSK